MTAAHEHWVLILTLLLAGIDMPTGDLLARSESAVRHVGAGRRASTLKARDGALKVYLEWLKTRYGLQFFTRPEHLLVYLRKVVDEGRTRGAVKCIKAAFGFAEHVASIPLTSQLARSNLFISLYTELLNSARVGAPPRPVPRPLLILISALENFVMVEARLHWTEKFSLCVTWLWKTRVLCWVLMLMRFSRLVSRIMPSSGASASLTCASRGPSPSCDCRLAIMSARTCCRGNAGCIVFAGPSAFHSLAMSVRSSSGLTLLLPSPTISFTSDALSLEQTDQ